MSMLIPDEYLLKPESEIIPDRENDYIEVRNDNTTPPLQNTIRIHYRNTNSYINLSKSYLEINFQITANSDTHTLVNHVLSLFRRATLKLGNITVEQVENQNLNILVNSIIKYSQDYALSSGSNSFFYRDTGDANALTTISGVANVANLDYNSGYHRRLKRSDSGVGIVGLGNNVSCRVPLGECFQFANVNKLIYGQELEVELVQSQNVDRLFGDGALASGVNITKCSLWLNKVLPSKQAETTFLKQIQGNVSYDFNYLYSNCYVSSVLQATQNTIRISTQSENIQYAYVMCIPSVYTTAISKTRSENNIRGANILLDNVRFPTTKYESLDKEEGKSRTYHALSQMVNGFDASSGLSLSFDDYKRTTIIPFDLRNKEKNLSGSPTQIELEVDIVTAQCRVLVVLQSDRVVNMNYRGGIAVVKVN